MHIQERCRERSVLRIKENEKCVLCEFKYYKYNIYLLLVQVTSNSVVSLSPRRSNLISLYFPVNLYFVMFTSR